MRRRQGKQGVEGGEMHTTPRGRNKKRCYGKGSCEGRGTEGGRGGIEALSSGRGLCG